MNPIYPFGAVVGQEQFKLALLLTAIDPAIGGVLVRGPRGVAKTTLARGLAELVPGRFVELPLGATEERVTGTLDLGSALRDGAVQFAPGLLAQAHDGVLYVDEVNLLPDALVDVLLDAAASGVNTVERDGVSHRHAARFVLVGTMNPDEGELRPQLIDRFGLAVHANATLAPHERAEIVARRLDFDRDPAAFVARHHSAQQALIERCSTARARAHSIEFSADALARISERCYAAGVEGVRADLAMLRAARAHAAWHGRTHITEADIEAVAELALAHRRPRDRAPGDDGNTGSPSSRTPSAGAAQGERTSSVPSASSKQDAESAGAEQHQSSKRDAERDSARYPSSARASRPSARTDTTASGASDALGAAIDTRATSTAQGERGALPASAVRAVAMRKLPNWLGAPPRAQVRSPKLQQRARTKTAPAASRSIDWFKTLARTRKPAPHDLRYRRRPMTRALIVVALDCSASMLRGGALAAAKGVARALLTAPGSARTEFALIAFSGARASACIARASGPRLERAVQRLGAGGGTPLSGALLDALALARRADQRHASAKRLLLITDGRTRDPITNQQPLNKAFQITVLDCERTRIRLGRARAIAQQLQARYAHIDKLLN